MRIILLNPPIGLIQELRLRQRHELLIADYNVSNYQNTFQNSRCSFFRLAAKKKLSLPDIRALRTTIRQFCPDVVHAFLSASLAQTIVACSGLRNRPHIVSFRGITRPPSRLDPGNWFSYLSRRISAHACESIAVKRSMVQAGVSDDKCEVTYNCVETAQVPESASQIRHRLGIPSDAFVVGTVACIRPVKGIDILLKAAMECASLPNIYFVIVGENKDDDISRLVNTEQLFNRVKLSGFIHDAHHIMKAFDLFVMPSRREGLCRAMLEAMEQSVCPIVSDAGGMKEMVRHQTDGIVFRSENVSELRDAITHLYKNRDKISQYSQSARVRVLQMCSPSVFTDRVDGLYDRLNCKRIAA